MIKEVKKASISTEERFVKEAQETKKTSESTKTFDDEQLYAMSKDDAVLEAIVNEVRSDVNKASDSNYRKIFNHVIKDNMREFSNIKNLVEKEKDSIYKRVKENSTFSVDISNKKDMRTHYKEIFGKRSNQISFDDYVALLEMKRLLEIDEQVEVADVEEI